MSWVRDNWKTQIKKGYLELSILTLIRSRGELYGFEIMSVLKGHDLEIKEGTLYPLLNRMVSEKVLSTYWDTKNVKGHPRKFYLLTPSGQRDLDEMQDEFKKMNLSLDRIKSNKGAQDDDKSKVGRVGAVSGTVGQSTGTDLGQ